MITNEIINKFHKSESCPENVKRKFWWWLLNVPAKEQSEQAMEELFNNTHAETTQETWNDLIAINKKIQQGNTGTWRRSNILKIAAVLLPVILITSVVTFYLTKDYVFASRNSENFVQITVPSGQTRNLELGDHTSVMLNAGSTLIYPEVFHSDTRKVFLIGEANFDVSHDAKRPFLVQTQELQVRVLGTKFNIKSYTEDSIASATLLRGRIMLCVNRGNDSIDSFKLMPNQQLAYDKASGKVTITKINADRLLSWEKGYLVFDGASFSQVLNSLQRHYNLKFICSKMSIMKGDYYAKFGNNEDISDVLNILSKLNHNFCYRIDGNEVYITPK